MYINIGHLLVQTCSSWRHQQCRFHTNTGRTQDTFDQPDTYLRRLVRTYAGECAVGIWWTQITMHHKKYRTWRQNIYLLTTLRVCTVDTRVTCWTSISTATITLRLALHFDIPPIWVVIFPASCTSALAIYSRRCADETRSENQGES